MTIPHDHSLGNTLRLLHSEGYEFVSNRCRRFGTDIFSTRILFKKTVCMQGSEAAEQFYSPGRFTRRRAMPQFALRLLQDYGSVQMLDHEDHRLRKQMSLSMMTPEKLAYLAELTAFTGGRRRGDGSIWKASSCSMKPTYHCARRFASGAVSSCARAQSGEGPRNSKP
jgi:hypothetical protein